MSNIMLAWEIGDGHGHVRNLLAVADLLRAKGHKIVFALSSNQITAFNFIMDRDYIAERFIYPMLPSLNQYLSPLQHYHAASFVDIIGLHAVDSTDRLKPFLSHYIDIIKKHHIDAIVCETAPIATLIANVLKIPVISIGTSFGLPEAENGFSAYPQLGHMPLTPLFDEGKLLKNISISSGVEFKTFADGFKSHRIVPFCYPPMDHYGTERCHLNRGVGPIWKMNRQEPAERLCGFAYLQESYPAIKQLISAIRLSGIPFNVFVRNGKYQSAKNMTVVDSFDAEQEIARASFVLHHGSAGIGQAALSAGIPQVCMPYHIENINNAYRLQMLGVSRAIGHGQSRQFLEFLLDDQNLTTAAQSFATQLEQHSNEFQGAVVAAEAVSSIL